MTASPSPAPRIAQLARSAVRALYAEVALEPKPGLVSFRDNGSHTDMTAATFLHSLFALRHYFGHIAQAGFEGADFGHLQALGLAAEARMLRATGGVNTHRGAVFRSVCCVPRAGAWPPRAPLSPRWRCAKPCASAGATPCARTPRQVPRRKPAATARRRRDVSICAAPQKRRRSASLTFSI